MSSLHKLLGFRDVRVARRHDGSPIALERRDLFERYGETVIQLVIAGGLNPSSPALSKIYTNEDCVRLDAEAWLTQRGDEGANKDHRLELVEWSVLIFVIIGVFADFSLVFHWFK